MKKQTTTSPQRAKAIRVVRTTSAPHSRQAVERRDKPKFDARFAAVSRAEAMALGLPVAQRAAIEKLTTGHTVVDSAIAAGVSRTTLHRWLKDDLNFIAAFNAWQQDALATARGRLLALTDAAVTTVSEALHNGDARLALRLLERLGITAPPTPGSTDVQELERQQVLERKRRDIERRREAHQVEIDNVLTPGM